MSSVGSDVRWRRDTLAASGGMLTVERVTTRNARFQQWEALLTNRNKRQRSGEFLVQGVRPITLAVEHGWEIRALLYNPTATLSTWATRLLDKLDCAKVAVAPGLLGVLGGKADAVPELLAVVATRADELDRIRLGSSPVILVLDRPTSPGNVGALVRSADAFGAAGVIVTGHAADVYDPKVIRASTGSLFAVPTVRVPSHQPVLDWVEAIRLAGTALRVVGTDERADVDIAAADLTVPLVVLVGNETTGLSSAWRQAVEVTVRIPIAGAASSLNAATAASILLYEASRQRNAH
jgi:23S rRNA (uridine2479-2'-O)-methyltransferase